MDSEDSRDASSGSESNGGGPRSPDSEPKSRSSSRSSSPPASPQRTSDKRFSQKIQTARSRSNSLTSLSSDEERDPKPRNRPHTPKTPESDDNDNSRKIHTPASPPPDDAADRNSPLQPGSPQSRYSSRSNSPKRLPSKSNDNASVKSVSSRSSRKSVSSRESDKRVSERSRRKSDNESSYSSDSSLDSSSRPKVNVADTQPEEISDGDIESDNEKKPESPKPKSVPKPEMNMAHEDLSDVSDLDESIGHSDDEARSFTSAKEHYKTTVQETNSNRSHSPEIKKVSENASRSDENEEQLDFEAEDGECGEEVNREKDEFNEKNATKSKDKEKTDDRKEEKEELEEGEVTDDDDVRPEETQPRPVCRFFSRGQCTWGESCRFLHPGVTDKGNYTMFELIRPVVPGEYGREDRIYGKPDPPLVESAWERGLRTAKEMLRKSVKRKEQDIDFEEKKMNLSLAQEEFDKENGYYGRGPSPEPRFVRHIPADYPVARPPPPPEEYYPRRQVLYEHEYPPAPPPPRERGRPYRELPPHRMPDYYTNKYEEEPQTSKQQRPRPPKREVIVQRAEERPARADEWSDPWMRSKSPAGAARRKERKRSYSSGSSYSSSSSSRSSSGSSRSSYRSRSRSSYRRRRSRSRRSRQVSPSVIVSERKAANERAALMNPPAPKRRAPSPGMMRVSGAANPPAPPREDFGRSRSKLAMAAALARVKARKSSKSSSGSSGSSSSDSDSSDSSSSTSRDGSSPTRRPPGPDISLVKAMDALKGSALEKKQIKLNLKNPVGAKKPETAEFARKMEQTQGKKRPASPPSDKSKKATSRREELLKQLKAVEDAIAKKRSKGN